jgi:hypothetical protein
MGMAGVSENKYGWHIRKIAQCRLYAVIHRPDKKAPVLVAKTTLRDRIRFATLSITAGGQCSLISVLSVISRCGVDEGQTVSSL